MIWKDLLPDLIFVLPGLTESLFWVNISNGFKCPIKAEQNVIITTVDITNTHIIYCQFQPLFSCPFSSFEMDFV